MKYNHPRIVVDRALADYQSYQKTTAQIARTYRVSPATLTVWAKRAGMPLRGRGRRQKTEPDLRQRKIIELAGLFTYCAVGKAFGLTVQGVSRIVNRWKVRPLTNATTKPSIEPSPCAIPQLTDQDITGDIARVIAKSVRPFIDQSNPMLHFDELQAECRAKLAKIISDGVLAKCRTRGEVFAFLKTCFRNHVRSLVQKHAFTAKRTGHKPAPRTAEAGAKKVFEKPCMISLDAPEHSIQLGKENELLRLHAFLEELSAVVTPEESAVLRSLLKAPSSLGNAALEPGKLPDRFPILRSSIRRKFLTILRP